MKRTGRDQHRACSTNLYFGNCLARCVMCSLIILPALSGCAYFNDRFSKSKEPAPSTANVVSTPTPMERPHRSKGSPNILAQKEAEIKNVRPENLVGLDTDSVQNLLGEPSQIRNEDLSREWIYARQGCLFSVFFYPDLEGRSYRVLKYAGHNIGEEGVSDVCVSRVMAEKNYAN